MSIGIITVEFLVIGVCSQGLISLKTLLVTELLFRHSPFAIASQFDIPPFAVCET